MIALSTLLALLHLPAAPKGDQIALMPLTALGSTADTSAAIEQVVIGELTTLLGDQLVLPDSLSKQVARAVQSCEGEVGCLTEALGGAGWRAFIVGSLAGLGDDRVVHLKIVDVRTGEQLRTASGTVSGDEAQMIRTIRRAAVQIAAPHRFVGRLELSGAQPGVTVKVDGREVGTTPLTTPTLELTVGPHALEATGAGLVPYSAIVEVQYDETVPVDFLLPSSSVFIGGDAPFRHRWWTWSIAGAGVIAVGLGGYFNALQADTASRIEERIQAGTLRYDTSLYREEEDNWKRAVVSYGIGGALMLTSMTLLSLDFL